MIVGSKIEKPAQSSADDEHNKIVTQTVKWCTHCQKPYHTNAECHVLHPHLKAAANKRKADKKKRREKGNERNEQRQSKKNKEKKKNKKNKPKEES